MSRVFPDCLLPRDWLCEDFALVLRRSAWLPDLLLEELCVGGRLCEDEGRVLECLLFSCLALELDLESFVVVEDEDEERGVKKDSAEKPTGASDAEVGSGGNMCGENGRPGNGLVPKSGIGPKGK